MFLLLFLLWLILNGTVTLEIVLVGIAISALVTLVTMRLTGFDMRREVVFLRAIPWFVAWFCLLLVEIFKANITMIRIILNPGIAVRQMLVAMDSGLKTEVARAMLSNSITLTPGTITVESKEDGVMVVHCLSWEMLEGIQDGRLMRMIRRVEALYGQSI